MSRREEGSSSPGLHTHGAQVSYFTYTDANGVQVVVDRLADVPEQYRAEAKHIDLSKPALDIPAIESRVASEGRPVSPSPAGKLCLGETPGCIHAWSFLLGAAVALVMGGVGMLVFRKSARLVAIVAGIIIVAALTTAILTHARRQSGLPGDGLVTPGALLDDARAAAKAVNEHHREQARSLDELEQQR
jgi:hypothetical protein